MKEKIIAALKGLDPRNSEHWTAEGLPALKALNIEGLKRSDVTEAAPHFTRDNPALTTPNDEIEKEKRDTAAKMAEDAKAKLGTIEEQKAALQVEIDRVQKVMVEARAEYVTLLEKMDVLVRHEQREGVARKPIHDIMDFIASQQKLREDKAKALKGG